MRTAAAAQSSMNTPAPSTQAYLVPPGVLNNSLTVSVRSEPYDRSVVPPINFNALGASMMLAILDEFSEASCIQRRKNRLEEEKEKRRRNGSKRVKFTDYDVVIASPGPSVYEISFGVWIIILDYLLCENTLRFVPDSEQTALTDSKFAIPSSLSAYPNRIKRLKSALQRCPILSTNHFFSSNYRKDFEMLPMLLDNALNADLAIVKSILENATSELCQKLLSTEYGTGKTTARLGRVTIERTGTPLQMAIYDHDEEMVAFFKEIMNPAEFQRQCEAVVGSDYDAFLKKQEFEATELCAGLEDVFKQSRRNEFTANDNWVASTTSQQTSRTIDAFINKLMDYVKNNPVHNPTILQRVYEIYSRLPFELYPDCFFTQKVIGGVQSFLSARWLQHYAQGIYYLAENNEVPRRSFICRNSSPTVDIRHLVGSCIGSDSFLCTVGVVVVADIRLQPSPLADECLQKLCRAKSASFQNFMPRAQSTRSCIIQ